MPPEILGQGPLGTGLQVSLIFWGWMLAQYPLLIPPSFTIAGSAAPDATLRALLIATAFGGIVL
ncbi:MAG: cytochrome d ubiquinol oxidase subunit II, partial [Gemmatimonadales bacterium]